MHGPQKKAKAKSRMDVKPQPSSFVEFEIFLFTSGVCTDHLGTPFVSSHALQPWIVILANN